MAIPHANPGEVIDVRPLGAGSDQQQNRCSCEGRETLEVVRLVLTAGKEITEHKAPGEITVQCLEGKVAFTALGTDRELTAGQMLYLGAGEPHALKCLEDASVLAYDLVAAVSGVLESPHSIRSKNSFNTTATVALLVTSRVDERDRALRGPMPQQQEQIAFFLLVRPGIVCWNSSHLSGS